MVGYCEWICRQLNRSHGAPTAGEQAPNSAFRTATRSPPEPAAFGQA